MAWTCAELMGSGSEATALSNATFMIAIVSGGNDAFEKSFIWNRSGGVDDRADDAAHCNASLLGDQAFNHFEAETRPWLVDIEVRRQTDSLI